MLYKEVEKIKKNGKAKLEQRQVACSHCGQGQMLEVPVTFTKEQLEEYAVEMCECLGAKDETRKKQTKEKAYKAIDEQFGEKSAFPQPQGILVIMQFIIIRLMEGQVEKATIDLGNSLKAKLSVTSKGFIKVEREKKEQTSQEV